MAFAERMSEGGRALPRHVTEEFESLLRCGVLACGFVRARCAGCGHDRLVPPPRTPLVRYHGVLAPNSPWRVAVVPLPVADAGCPCATTAPAVSAMERPENANARGAVSESKRRGNGDAITQSGRIEWARLSWRVWDIDALACPACGGRMKMIAALIERAGIVRVLEHLGVSTEVPRMRRGRDGPPAGL